MPAGVFVAEMNGSDWSTGNITKLSGQGVSTTARYCTMDSATPGQTNPIPIPTSGHNPSYWKTHFLFISGQNGGTYDFTYISSIRWYCDGDMFNWGSTKSSGAVFVMEATESAGYGTPSGEYVQATGTLGTSGNKISTHTDYNASSNAEDYNALGTDLSVDNRKIVPNDSAGFVYSKALIHQAWIGSNAASGNPGTETFVWVWDEVS
ncbi:MAG: hypothetical protein U9O83_07185 [Campylobacterota bacterium]|nr:hypothetical protein [Campylobacterota bacterium]